jgi:hypothetical protein
MNCCCPPSRCGRATRMRAIYPRLKDVAESVLTTAEVIARLEG